MAPKKIVTSQKGRKCKYPGCESILSIYNHNVYCHADLNKISRQAAWPGQGIADPGLQHVATA